MPSERPSDRLRSVAGHVGSRRTASRGDPDPLGSGTLRFEIETSGSDQGCTRWPRLPRTAHSGGVRGDVLDTAVKEVHRP